MDPITVIQLIASAESLADGAFKLVSIIKTMKQGGKQRLRLLNEVNSLWMVLTLVIGHLEIEEENFSESLLMTVVTLNEDNGIFDQIRKLLEDLQIRLQPMTGRHKVIQNIRWPFDKFDVETSIAQVNRLKDSVNLVFTSSSAAAIREIRNDAKAIKLAVANEQIKAVLEWISSSNFLKQQDTFARQVREGTGKWFLERQIFQKWTLSDQCILWAPGIPGAGKTFLASIVFDFLKTLLPNQSTAILILYCGYSDAKSQSVDNLVAALIKQTLQARPGLSANLKQTYESFQRSDTFPSLEKLIELLYEELVRFDKCFIIVDALDEIREESNRLELLNILNLAKASIMITSRPLDTIKDLFKADVSCDSCENQDLKIIFCCKHCPSDGFSICGDCYEKGETCGEDDHYMVKRFGANQIQIQASQSDIRNYVHWRIDYEPKLRDSVHRKKELRQEITETLVQQANGMFLLARLHMDTLATKRTPRAVQQGLKNLPTEINETYDQTIQRIMAINEDDRKIVMNFLLWLTFSLRPLNVAEVEHATAIVPGEAGIELCEILTASELTSMCAGLITVDASDIIRFVHFSAQNYLSEHKTQLFANGHNILAHNCMTYLLFDAFDDGACSGPSESEELQLRTQKYPLLDYCCTFWSVHILRSESKDIFTTKILEILRNQAHFETIVQILWYSDSPELADWDIKSGVLPLHLAAYLGLEEVVQQLLRTTKIVDCKDSMSTTPLMYAASKGSTSIMQALLDKGANVNAVCDRSTSVLHRAIVANDILAAHLLLDQPDISLQVMDTSRSDQTPLMLAASLGCSEILQLILDKPSLDVNAHTGSYQDTALTIAARSGDAKIVGQLLCHPKIDVNKSNKATTPLIVAATRGYLSVVETLLEFGADPTKPGDEYWASGTALNRAIDNGHVSIVRLLLERGANPKVVDVYNRTVIHSAAVNGQTEILRVLFDAACGVDVNGQGNNGRTALHDAAYFNYCDTIEILFEHGARTDIHDNADRSPLGVAKDQNNLEAVELLTRLRKQESIRDETGGYSFRKNPSSHREADDLSLITAAKLGRVELTKSIISRAQTDTSIDVNMVDLDRHSALHCAISNFHTDVLKLLLSAKDINVNIRDRLKRTPLHFAAMNNDFYATKCLLDAGASVHVQDHFEDTPLDHSLTSRYDDVSILLLNHGALPSKDTLQLAMWMVAEKGDPELARRLVKDGADPGKKDVYGQTPYHIADYFGNKETAKEILVLCERRAEVLQPRPSHSSV